VLIGLNRLARIHLIQLDPILYPLDPALDPTLDPTLDPPDLEQRDWMSVKPLTKGSSSFHLHSTFGPPSVHLPSTSDIGLAPIRFRSVSISAVQSCLAKFPSQRSTTATSRNDILHR
jgi:hypothetical protein